MVGGMRRGAAPVLVVLLGVAGPAPALAQEHVTVTADLIFYGDNTEFRNPFRKGDTVFGTTARVGAEIGWNDRVRLRVGVLGDRRFGSETAFDLVRPIAALEVHGGGHRVGIGTLPPPRVLDPPGPDRAGPRGLLPPLQRETLAFERPYEAGLFWGYAGQTFDHEAWLNWQRLNTLEHRERFDAGFAGRLRAGDVFFVPVQFHIVHEGGQLHAAGPVSDSYAGGLGGMLEIPAGAGGTLTVESIVLASRHVPDRELPASARNGAATFNRVAFTRGDFRLHAIVWRGNDFIKDEGDPNYHSMRRDGRRWRGIRDYAETGVTRVFRPAEGVGIEVSGRLHRVERHYEYSYRVLVVAGLRARVGR
jgi:hypothetical protein